MKSIVELVTLILTAQLATTIYNGISHEPCVLASRTHACAMTLQIGVWYLLLFIRLIWRRLPSFGLKILYTACKLQSAARPERFDVVSLASSRMAC